MLLHKINKKGVFLPLFVVLYIVILGGLLLVMKEAASNKEDLIGLRAVNMLKADDEIEKAMLYLDLSSKYASSNSASPVITVPNSFS